MFKKKNTTNTDNRYRYRPVVHSADLSRSGTTVVRRHRPNYKIVLFLMLLMIIGLIVIYAIGPDRANVLNSAYGSNYSSDYFFKHQLLNIGLSIIFFIVAYLAPYDKILKLGKPLMVVSFGLCFVLVIADRLGLSIANQALGATRWLQVGPISIQPAELLKLSFIIYLAGFLNQQKAKNELNDFPKTIFKVLFYTGLASIFIFYFQKDFGTGAAFLTIVVSMMFVAGLDRKILLKLILVLVIAGILLMVTSPHRLERITTYLKGDNTSLGSDDSYQIDHAKIAIGTGGALGVGIGNSVQATGYLPESINDSIFAVMGEMFGFVGLMIILFIFTSLLLCILETMDYDEDNRLKLMVAGIFGWLAAHVVLNIGAMLGVIPLTGITLPIVSYGGTSMFMMCGALGIVFQASAYTVVKPEERNKYENINSRRRVGRTRYASSSSLKRA